MKEAEQLVARTLTDESDAVWAGKEPLYEAAVTFGATALRHLTGKHLRKALKVAVALREYSDVWKVEEDKL